MKITSKINLYTRGQFAVLIAIASILVVIGGYFIYRYQANKTLQAKEKTLTAIATLKSKQISDWFLDELNDIQVIASDPYLDEDVKKTQRSNALADKSRLTKFLSQIKIEQDYKDVVIASADGKLEIWDGEQPGVLNDVELRTIEKAYIQKKTLSTDLFRHELNGEEKILISFISLIKDADNNILAALIGRKDASLSFYPIIEEWPTPSQTAESYLFRVEADSIVYLNNLKHTNNAALNLRIPVKNTELLASQAVSGKLGLVSGKDYRNEDVTGYTSKIEGTPWYLISKIDDSEMNQGKYVIAGVTVVFVLIIIFIIIFFIIAIFNRRQKYIFKELYIKEREVWQQQEKFKVTMDSLGEGVIVTDMDAKVQYINKHAEALTGWNYSDALGRNLGEVYPLKNEETGEKENNILEKVIKHGIVKELTNHTLLVLKSGKEIPVMDTGAPIFDDNGSLTGVVITFQDETEKRTKNRLIKESEKNLREFFENDITGDYSATADGEILMCNPAFIEILGYATAEEIIGRNIAKVYQNPDEREEFLSLIQNQKVVRNYKSKLKRKDGTYVICNENVVGKFDANGNMVHYFGYMYDITYQIHAEEEIRKSESYLSLIFANTPDLLFVQDCNLTYSFIVNPAHPLTPEDVIGKSDWDLLPPEEAKVLTELKKRIIETGEPIRQEICLSPSGIPRWYEMIYQPIFENDGQKAGIVSYSRDITERKLSEEALLKKEQLLSSVMETQQELICRFLPDTTLTFVNKAYCKIFGKTEEELIGQKFLELVPESEWEDVFSNLKSLNEENPQITYESSAFKADGSVMTMEWTDIAIFNEEGDVLKFQSVGHDITEKLKTLNDLRIAKEKAEESDKLKTAFINNISHEIRTPLNGILGFGQFLVGSELSEEERSEFFEHVKKSSNRLINTVTDYMDIAMLVSNTMIVNKKEFALKPVFETITEKNKQFCSTKNIKFEIAIPIESAGLIVNSDPEFIQKILDKLLENAYKFTRQGSIICGYKIKTEHLEFFVKDTGSGIDNDMQDLIFEMFRQEDSSMTRGYEGSGLGLTIAKGLVTLLGGQIYVSSEKGKGSEFKFTIPIKNSGKSILPDAIDITKPKSTKTPLILIAEDDDLNYLFLEAVLDSLGYNYIHAVNGKEAVDFCRQNPEISIVLMDIKMPVLNGVEATKQIRVFRPELPIIATTAYTQTGDEHRFLEAGCNDYLPKPIIKEKLLTIIKKYVE